MQIWNINMEIDILSVVWWILCKCSRKNAKKIERYIDPFTSEPVKK